jgi:hypothetical protein
MFPGAVRIVRRAVIGRRRSAEQDLPLPRCMQGDDLEHGTARQTSSFAGDDEEETEWDFEYRVRGM